MSAFQARLTSSAPGLRASATRNVTVSVSASMLTSAAWVVPPWLMSALVIVRSTAWIVIESVPSVVSASIDTVPSKVAASRSGAIIRR